MKKKEGKSKVFIYFLILLLIIVVFLNMYKKLPEGISLEGKVYSVSEESVTFLRDVTYMEDGERKSDQQIFDEIFNMIESAEKYILLDMFLFNDFQGKTKETTRELSGELTDVLIKKKQDNPNISILVISDPINNIYGGGKFKHFKQLEQAGIRVIVTDLSKLRDSNTIYSALWRTFFKWFGNNGNGGLLTNPLSYGDKKVTLRTYLSLLNFKANHRKVVVSDNGPKMATLVTSANPHDASSAHSNVAVKVEGDIWKDAVESEKAVLRFSGKEENIFNDLKDVQSNSGDVLVQLLTEGKIRDKVVDLINETKKGDSVDMVMFYLSDRRVVRSIKSAMDRGVLVRLVLDPNKDAFGREKNGVPNRPVAHELRKSGGDNYSMKWCSTHGEQCHSKLVLINSGGKYSMILGSANLTRRNIGDLNLETNILVSADTKIKSIADAYEYMDTIWNNEGGRLYTEEYEKYGESSLYKTILYRIMETLGTSSF